MERYEGGVDGGARTALLVANQHPVPALSPYRAVLGRERPRREVHTHLVGEAISRSGVDRSDLFVTTKLGVEQLDLWLMHQPLPSDFSTTHWDARQRSLGKDTLARSSAATDSGTT